MRSSLALKYLRDAAAEVGSIVSDAWRIGVRAEELEEVLADLEACVSGLEEYVRRLREGTGGA